MSAAPETQVRISPQGYACANLLQDLSELAEDAAMAASHRVLEFPDAAGLREAVRRLFALAALLIGLAVRIGAGQGFPKARARRAAEAASARAAPAPAAPADRTGRDPGPRLPVQDLFALGLPEAEALRDRLAALLADPEMDEMMAFEPSVWRAAAPLLRLLGLPVPPRPRPCEPGPIEWPDPDDEEDDAPPAARPAPRRPEPPPHAEPPASWHRSRPDGGADPPSGCR